MKLQTRKQLPNDLKILNKDLPVDLKEYRGLFQGSAFMSFVTAKWEDSSSAWEDTVKPVAQDWPNISLLLEPPPDRSNNIRLRLEFSDKSMLDSNDTSPFAFEAVFDGDEPTTFIFVESRLDFLRIAVDIILDLPIFTKPWRAGRQSPIQYHPPE